MPSQPNAPRYLSRPFLSSFQPAQNRPVLGNITNIPSTGDRNNAGDENMRPATVLKQETLPAEEVVSDPGFVLGITKGASEDEQVSP
jgi:hypothetical protein